MNNALDNFFEVRSRKIFHTTVYPGENLFTATVRAGVEAGRNGFDGYCIDCDICRLPVKDHDKEDTIKYHNEIVEARRK